MTDELLACRLLSIHNLHYTLSIMREARAAIEAGRFKAFRARTIGQRVT